MRFSSGPGGSPAPGGVPSPPQLPDGTGPRWKLAVSPMGSSEMNSVLGVWMDNQEARQKNSSWMLSGSRKVSMALDV